MSDYGEFVSASMDDLILDELEEIKKTVGFSHEDFYVEERKFQTGKQSREKRFKITAMLTMVAYIRDEYSKDFRKLYKERSKEVNHIIENILLDIRGRFTFDLGTTIRNAEIQALSMVLMKDPDLRSEFNQKLKQLEGNYFKEPEKFATTVIKRLIKDTKL